jgi:hypothetical protein
MALLKDFSKWVRPSVPMCPEPVLLDAILQSAIEFCERTRCNVEVIEITTIVGQAIYPIAVQANYEPSKLLSLKRDIYPLRPADYRDVEVSPLYNSTNPTDFFMDADNTLYLYPTPLASEVLTLSLVTNPTVEATEVPDMLMTNRRYLTIAAGAKARLMIDSGDVPWANPQLGVVQAAAFESGIDREMIRRAKGGGQKRLRTKGTYF